MKIHISMDKASQCIQDSGGLVVLRRSSTGQFDPTTDFTHIAREFERIHTIRVQAADICAAWKGDLATWGLAHPRLCIMERITDSFLFFMNAQLPPDAEAVALVPILRKVIREFGFDADQCAVLQDTADAASNRYVWADVRVNTNRAYVIRERIIAELSSRDTGEHACAYRWAEVFGGKAYDACLPGPSLPGSLKFVPCTECKNRAARRQCTRCMLRGYTISPGVMAPLALIHFSDGAMSRDPVAPQLEQCTIHTTCPVSATWRVPPGTPFCTHAAAQVVPIGGRNFRRKEVDLPADTLALLQRVIRPINVVCAQLVVTNRSVSRASSDKYVIHPCGIGSHSCIKFRSEHKDSYVYFVVTPRGVRQRCYSDEKLVCGTSCKHRDAHCVPLDERVVRQLFPSFTAAPAPNISNSTQSSAYQIATRVSDYHANIIRGGAGRKRNVYGDLKKAPAAANGSRHGKRTSHDDDQ